MAIALAPKQHHRSGKTTRRMTMQRARIEFRANVCPHFRGNVPLPQVGALLQVRHTAIDPHRVVVNDGGVFMSRRRKYVDRTVGFRYGV